MAEDIEARVSATPESGSLEAIFNSLAPCASCTAGEPGLPFLEFGRSELKETLGLVGESLFGEGSAILFEGFRRSERFEDSNRGMSSPILGLVKYELGHDPTTGQPLFDRPSTNSRLFFSCRFSCNTVFRVKPRCDYYPSNDIKFCVRCRGHEGEERCPPLGLNILPARARCSSLACRAANAAR